MAASRSNARRPVDGVFSASGLTGGWAGVAATPTSPQSSYDPLPGSGISPEEEKKQRAATEAAHEEKKQSSSRGTVVRNSRVEHSYGTVVRNSRTEQSYETVVWNSRTKQWYGTVVRSIYRTVVRNNFGHCRRRRPFAPSASLR
eukprot:161146-Pyramimonas_sp.AAC.1